MKTWPEDEKQQYDYETWEYINLDTVAWRFHEGLVTDRFWGTCPCPHCTHPLDQQEDHLVGDTLAIVCPNCGEGSWFPEHPLHQAWIDARFAVLDAVEHGATEDVVASARAAAEESGEAWQAPLTEAAVQP